MTYVTCPTMRYHPAVVAQKAATIQLLSDGRFTLGLGAGRTSTSTWWAAAGHRSTSGTRGCGGARDHLRALRRRIRRLLRRALPGRLGEAVGRPDKRVPIAVAVSGEQSVRTRGARRPPDHGRARCRPLLGLGRGGHESHSRKIGQLPVCWGHDRDACVDRAHEQFRWFGGGGRSTPSSPGPQRSPPPPSS